MVNKSRYVDPGKLTAYERWELPNIGQDDKPQATVQAEQTKIRPPTAEEIESIRQQAFEEGKETGCQAGFEEGHKEGFTQGEATGFDQGFEQGLTEGQSKIEMRLAQLDALLSEVTSPIEKQQALIEEAIFNLSTALSKAVIQRELELDSSTIKIAIQKILQDLPKPDKGFVVTINPVDETAVKPVLERYASEITLKLDEALDPGGFILNSSRQLVDYTIDKRFQKTVQAMLDTKSEDAKSEGQQADD